MEEFRQLGLSEETITVLEKKGFSKPTQIQAQAIPLLLKGEKDVLGQSQTGTGKTASFALPIIEKITGGSKTVQAIILTPTRELAMQVAKEIDSLKGKRPISVLAVYGGSPIGPQRSKLRSGVDIVVGTPGRILDLQNQKVLKLNHIKYAVLDEADEMLNMGFVEDIETILQHSPKEKAMLLFSATMPKQIVKIAKKYMREHEVITVEKSSVTTQNVEQVYYNIKAKDRNEALKRIIEYHGDFYGIIFCNTKATVDSVTQKLNQAGFSAAAIHGDFAQNQREKILQQFRNKYIEILVATDVAARGIDVTGLTHVVNYSLPQSPESYVHRIGRTGRAGNKGISITFVIPSERNKLRFVEKINNCKLTKQTLPTIEEIVAHKEELIKTIIKNILEKNISKESKFKKMAHDLLEDNNPKEVVAALLKYFLKNELETHQYKSIEEPEMKKSSSRPSRRERSRNGSRSRARRGNGSGGYQRSRSNNSRGSSSDRNRSRKRTDKKRFERKTSSSSDKRKGGSSSSRRSSSNRDDSKGKRKPNFMRRRKK